MEATNVKSLFPIWEERLKDNLFSEEYKDGVRDCLYELRQVENDMFFSEYPPCPEEMFMTDKDWKDYYESMEADSYLSSFAEHATT